MERISAILKSVPSLLFSWRSIAILLLLVNLKNLPGAWTYRVFRQLITAHRRELARLKKQKASASSVHPLRASIRKSAPEDPISAHPLFTPETITTHAPLLEIDYNLHKSNSTYFTDLDVSRSKLMGKLTATVWPLHTVPLEIDPSKAKPGTSAKDLSKGKPNIILGAVHTSFRKEIEAYAPYQVQSRLLAWDSRWVYIGTWFYRSTKGGEETTLLASSLSKYIIKKGRITVRPETLFKTAGWIPDPTPHPLPDNAETLPTSTIEATSDLTQRMIKKVNEATIMPDSSQPAQDGARDWTWSSEEIEQERRRCLNLLEQNGWSNLDTVLESEFRL